MQCNEILCDDFYSRAHGFLFICQRNWEMIMNECARLEDLYLAEWRVGKKDRKSGAIVTWNHKFRAKL